MKTFALAVGLVACMAMVARANEQTDLTGKYTLVTGKKNGAAVDDTAKKAEYTATADKFTIKGGEITFVMSYKIIDAKVNPVTIDMEILEGPAGTKGSKAVGIVEVKGDMVKLAYSLDKENRPKDFDGKTGFYFELKKEKAK